MTETSTNKEFMIFSVNELEQIDFSTVLETSINTVRKSSDLTQTFVKWEGYIIPQCVQNLTTKEGPYSSQEMFTILNSEIWNSNLNRLP
jgi:hypothetical protein